jgi:hypothetical protein
MNHLQSLIIANIHNINELDIIIKTYNTHFIKISNKISNYNINDIINIIKSSNLKNVKCIMQNKYYKRVKQITIKNKNNNSIVCSCESTCRCYEKEFEETETMKEHCDYYIVNINEINNYIINDNHKLYAISFNLTLV